MNFPLPYLLFGKTFTAFLGSVDFAKPESSMNPTFTFLFLGSAPVLAAHNNRFFLAWLYPITSGATISAKMSNPFPFSLEKFSLSLVRNRLQATHKDLLKHTALFLLQPPCSTKIKDRIHVLDSDMFQRMIRMFYFS